MSSYRQILYQLVFVTKNRESAIAEDHCEELYKYISGVIENKKWRLERPFIRELHSGISTLKPSRLFVLRAPY